MKPLLAALLFSVVVVSTGCYHATVTTGLTPSTIVIDQPFASGWIYGLVPPKTVESAAKCPDGIAMVETELSFVNQLVSFLTLGIYTPMHIKVTCAMAGTAALNSPPSELMVAQLGTGDDVSNTFAAAADKAVDTGRAVYVKLDVGASD